MFVDTNPFLFSGKVCGAMARLSARPIVNVSSGGGETGLFVLEEQRASRAGFTIRRDVVAAAFATRATSSQQRCCL
jgi:hypothetical protein